MSQPQHYMPRRRDTDVTLACHALDTRVSCCLPFFPPAPLSSWHSGANHGSGSHWVYDGGAFVQKSMLIGKPVIMEEYGWMSAAARLQNLGTVSNFTRVEVEGGWQNIVVQKRLAGDMFWQFGLETGLSTGISTDVSAPYSSSLFFVS